MARYSFRKAIKALSVGVLSAVGGGVVFFWGGGVMSHRGSYAIAQNTIVSDGTLGDESSVITDSVISNRRLITEGAVRGDNLFHSFQEFNVVGKDTYFVVSPNIDNIFSRVTGSNPSIIENTLGTLSRIDGGVGLSSSTANLYLINPNGVVFGENASLDMGGSFSTTTAEELIFGNRGTYGVTSGEVPGQLLSVNPSAYLFGKASVGDIVNRSNLGVSNGQSISLLGGDVFILGNAFLSGGLQAQNGNINIGAVGGEGIVQVAEDGSLTFPSELLRADISIQNAFGTVAFGADSDISLFGNRIVIVNSLISSRVVQGASLDAVAGNILIDASSDVNINNAFVQNSIFQNATGRGGEITIKADSLALSNGSFLSAALEGIGSAGDIVIDVENGVTVAGGSVIVSNAGINAIGDSGNVTVAADSLKMRDGAVIASGTQGRGNAGNVLLNVGQVSLENFSVVSTSTAPDVIGSSGNITIKSDTVGLEGGSFIVSSALGTGDAGDIAIDATAKVLLSNRSGISSSVSSTATGDGGDINIGSRSLILQSGSQVASGSLGVGDSGDILLDIDGLVSLSETSGILSNNGPEATGDGGDIWVMADNLSIADGSQISSATAGRGNAGSISIDVEGDTVLRTQGGINSSVLAVSNIGTNTTEPGVTAGSIRLDTRDLRLLSDGTISSSLQRAGSAGDISIAVERTAQIDDGRIASVVFPNVVGDGGDIRIAANNLLLNNGAGISSSSLGIGNSGDILVRANEQLAITNNSGILSSIASTTSGNGGNIGVQADSIMISGGSNLTSSAEGNGSPGNIAVTGARRLFMRDGEISTISAFTAGGNVSITADRIQLEKDSDILSRTLDSRSDGGNITIVADDFIIALDDSDIIASAFGGTGGNIELRSPGFFGQNFTATALDADPDSLNGNNRADINATGDVSGVVTVPGISFLEDSLARLPDNLIASDQLISSSCIARSEDGEGTLVQTDRDGLALSPSAANTIPFSTGRVQPTTTVASVTDTSPTAAIDEPTGIYQLADGRLVMSQVCL